MHIVYILEHLDTRQFYVGYTTDLKRRVNEHNAHGRKFTTRKIGQWILVYAEAYRNERDALERERKLKVHGSAMYSLLKRITKSRLSQK